MSAASRHDPFAQRLKELDRQARQVRADLKSLTRAMEKPERLSSMPRPKSLEKEKAAVTPPRRADPVARPEPPPPPESTVSGELFAWRPPRPVRAQAPAPEAEIPPRPAASAPKAGKVLEDARFANYFSSGSFVRPPPSPGESNVQRNKAVFMFVIVIVVGFVLYSLIF